MFLSPMNVAKSSGHQYSETASIQSCGKSSHLACAKNTRLDLFAGVLGLSRLNLKNASCVKLITSSLEGLDCLYFVISY